MMGKNRRILYETWSASRSLHILPKYAN